MLHFQTTNCRYCTLDTNTNKTYGAQLKPGGGSDEAPSCWSRCLDIYVTMSLMSLCVAMAHGSAAVLLWWCGAVVVLSSVLLLTDCTCWLQPGVTGPETSGQWSHSGGAAHWPPSHPATSSTPSFRPALPLPALCLPCQEMVVTYTPLDKGTLDYCCGEQTHQWSQWSTCQNFSIYLPPPEMNHVKPFESC